MSSVYNGNPAVYPTGITIPSDGDGPGIHAADVNVAFEGLADRTAFSNAAIAAINTKLAAGVVTTYTTSQTIAVPAGAKYMRWRMWGAGGGGGGGSRPVGADILGAGGGGGGGAIEVEGGCPVTAAENIALVIGAAGTGGAGGASPADGGDGGNSTITRVTGSVLLATATGAEGGSKGEVTTAGVPGGVCFGRGGDSIRQNVSGAGTKHPLGELNSNSASQKLTGFHRTVGPQQGAYGRCSTDFPDPTGATTSMRGGRSPQGFAGGAMSTVCGTTSGNYYGGGPGGGGGAGPAGNGGGTNSASGNGNNGGVGGNGSNGSNAPTANSGAGGGGGTGAGTGTSAGNAGAGGNGADGCIILSFFGYF